MDTAKGNIRFVLIAEPRRTEAFVDVQRLLFDVIVHRHAVKCSIFQVVDALRGLIQPPEWVPMESAQLAAPVRGDFCKSVDNCV